MEIAVNFVKEVGQLLEELSPQGLHAIFERFRGILHEGDIDKRVQYTIEGWILLYCIVLCCAVLCCAVLCCGVVWFGV